MNRRPIQIAALGALLFLSRGVAGADEKFSDVEIRVIKQKYFQKRMRVEIGPDLSAILNKSFVYTWLGGGHLGFHISESIGILAEGALGYTMNKSDCETLGQKFRIEPRIPDVKYFAGGLLSYTPIYGKYQLNSGDVIYFDWYFLAGGGMTGLMMREGSCSPNTSVTAPIMSTNHITFGTGQRFAMDRNLTVNWNLKFMMVKSTDPTADWIQNVMVTAGLGYFL